MGSSNKDKNDPDIQFTATCHSGMNMDEFGITVIQLQVIQAAR